MTPQIDNLKNEYKNVQVPFTNGTQPQSIISAFTYNGPVIANNSISNKLSTGDVNPTDEKTKIPKNENISTNTQQNNSDNSGLTIKGYSLTQIREAMQKCGYSDISDFAKLNDEELYKRIINELDKCKQTFINNATLKEYLSDEELTQVFDNVITPQLFENGFFYAEIEHSVETILINFAEKGKDILLGDADTANAYIFVYKTLCNAGAVNAFENTNGLFDTLGADFKKLGDEEKISALKEHLDSIRAKSNIDSKSEQYNTVWLGELARLALCSKSAEEKKIIYDFIKSIEPELKEMAGKDSVYAEMIQVIRKSCGNLDDARDVDCHISKDAETLPKEIIEDMITEYQEGGIFYDMLTPEEREVMLKVSNEEDFEKLSPEEQAIFTNCKAKLDKARENAENLGEAVILRSGEDGDFTPEERSDAIQTICEGIKHLDQGTYEEFLNNIHTWYEEHRDELNNLNISEEVFTQLMLDASGGEYTTAIQPPIEGSTDGYEPSAYNQEAGIGFNNVTIPPNLVGQNNMQEYYAQLNEAYLSDNNDEQNQLPQYVGTDNNPELPNASITVVNTREECDKVALLDILSGKVALGDVSLMSYILEKFKVSDIAEKGRCLAEACDKYLNMLIGATENSVAIIKTFFASGGKGNCFARTRELQKIVDKENESNQHIQAPTCSMA